MIKILCFLEWPTDGKKGRAQFEVPYFMFHPHPGKLTFEGGWASYKTDDEAIRNMGREFDQVVTTGDLTIPVYARETEAVHALQTAHSSHGTVDVALALLQYGKDGRSQPLQVSFRLRDAKVKEMTPRSIIVGEADSHGFLVTFKAPPPKNVRTLEAPV